MMYRQPQKCENCEHYTTDHRENKPKGVKPFRTECMYDNCDCKQWIPGEFVKCVKTERFGNFA